MRSRGYALAATLVASFLACACAPELDKLGQRRSVRGTLGAEVYKAVCRRVAGTEMPSDVTGRRSDAICLGDPAAVDLALSAAKAASLAQPGVTSDRSAPDALTPRLLVLAERRAEIAQAVDDIFPLGLGDELEQLTRLLLPFYDPPEERVQEATRELAVVLGQWANPADPKVLDGLARVSRKGMAPREGSLGLTRGTLGAAHVREASRSLLPLVEDDPAVSPHFETLMSGLALELATTDVDGAPDPDTLRLKKLLLRSNPEFGTATPLFCAVRDARGLPTPTQRGGVVPFPFLDANADGLADEDGPLLQTQPSFVGRLPEPFATRGEGAVARDSFGRATGYTAAGASDPTQQLYQTQDADTSLLAGLLREAQKLFVNDSLTQQLSLVLADIVGEHAPTSKTYGALQFPYRAPNPASSPLLDLVHASTAVLDQPVTPATLAITQTMLDTHEASIADSIEPMLTLERRTRPGSDAYPAAKLAAKHTFWDELLEELAQISRRRLTRDGMTLLEALTRASLGVGRNLKKPGAPIEQLVDQELLRHQGVVLASLARFKDEWRGNPHGQRERGPTEPLTLGAFRTPVDRSMPDSPITCGRDGCGGPIAGTLFEVWAAPNQNCATQRAGRPLSGKDCGQPPNQSLLQRSLGLIAEMANRSQCNKQITIANLLDYAVLKDPCVGGIVPDSPECVALRGQQSDDRKRSVASAETSVRDDYACPANAPADAPCRAYLAKYPAAFVDTDGDGGAPAAIQECHMLDLPDVGRTFGQAVTHEFTLGFPNPWVRRYLEDVARAGDHNGDGAPDLPACEASFKILDPAVPPPCIPGAASLSRDIYKDMPGSVDTLGEMVEYLLDDDTLFTNDDDTRDLRPDVKALSRVLFASAGSTSFVIFDPLLLLGAPAGCAAAPTLPACLDDDSAVTPAGGCCIKDLRAPPLRYRLDTFYGTTTFAWNQDIKLTNGTTLSFIDTMLPLQDAVTRYDFDSARDDPALFEDTDYLFSTLGKIVALHYDSAANPAAQSSNPKGLNYRHLTGLVSYEEMLADALDDGSIDLTQLSTDNRPLYAPLPLTKDQQLGVFASGLSFVQTLAQLSVDGQDGIAITSELSELLLNPHARCAGPGGDRRVIAGLGACDKQAAGEPGLFPPFHYRDGRTTLCWSDGQCFDGSARKKRFTSPAYALLDALDDMDNRSNVDVEHDHALRGVASGLLDAYAGVSGGRFVDRKLRALLSAMIATSIERFYEEQAAGTLSTFAQRTDDDTAKTLHNPVVAGGLGLFESLHGRGSALTDLSAVSASTLSEAPAQNNLRPLLAGLFDLVQLLPGDPISNAALRSFGSAFDTQVDAAVRGELVGGRPALLSPQNSALGRNIYMLRQTALLDTAQVSVMERVLQNLARVPDGRPSPLEVIVDTLLELDRVVPGAGTTPSGADLHLMLQNLANVMLDKTRGFERLYLLVHCTRDPKAPHCE